MILLSLNPSTDQFRKFINDLSYSVMLSFPIKNKEGEIIDFELKLFNPCAKRELPALQLWRPGATLWELFQEDAANGLFALYKKVLDGNTTHKSDYYSPVTKLQYHNALQSFYGGVLAIIKPSKAIRKRGSTSKDFDMRLAQYKAAVFEQYRIYL
ncbi:hypothetical protein [Spirosoma spitsbergense]|uniref:hypothetical protein n=1 Tax=Spirosoma spitsbergense TaxID=431554 RepID=UPI00036EE472|nr:hypothetical protein [Spirosoma spitsbergense]